MRDKQTIPLVLEGKVKEAQELQPAQNERFLKIRNIIRDLATGAERNAQTSVAQSAQRATQSILIFAGVSILAILLSLALVVFLNRIIASPLKDISGLKRYVIELSSCPDLSISGMVAGSLGVRVKANCRGTR